MELTLTVPFPCPYHSNAAHMNDIDDLMCPLHIELAVPSGSGGICQSRLTGVGSCGIVINAKRWNETHVINIIHQDTGNYQLTTVEAEMELYLKTYEFVTSKIWSYMLLPVVHVRNETYDCYFIQIYILKRYYTIYTKFIFLKRYTSMNWLMNGGVPVAVHTLTG